MADVGGEITSDVEGRVRYPEIDASLVIMGSSEVILDDKIFVAVGKELKESKSLLSWAIHNSKGTKICIIYVHVPAKMIPTPIGYMPASRLGEKEVNSFRENERKEVCALLDEYLRIPQNSGVQSEKLYIEADSIETGIIQLVQQHDIRKLVIGAASDKQYSRKMMEVKSKKAIYVRDNSPTFVHIWFICNGYLIHTREAINSPESISSDNTPVTAERNGGAGSPSAPPYYKSAARCSTGNFDDGSTSISVTAHDEFAAGRHSLSSPMHPHFMFQNDSGKASRLESMYIDECILRKETETELAMVKAELEWMKTHVAEMPKNNEGLESVELGKLKAELEYMKNNVVGEVRSAIEQKALLENQIGKVTFLLDMLGEKLASAINMVSKCDELYDSGIIEQ